MKKSLFGLSLVVAVVFAVLALTHQSQGYVILMLTALMVVAAAELGQPDWMKKGLTLRIRIGGSDHQGWSEEEALARYMHS